MSDKALVERMNKRLAELGAHLDAKREHLSAALLADKDTSKLVSEVAALEAEYNATRDALEMAKRRADEMGFAELEALREKARQDIENARQEAEEVAGEIFEQLLGLHALTEQYRGIASRIDRLMVQAGRAGRLNPLLSGGYGWYVRAVDEVLSRTTERMNFENTFSPSPLSQRYNATFKANIG